MHSFSYMQLYQCLQKEIVDGTYASGARMPSKRMLAERFSVSLITVQHAMALLEEEGYIHCEERRGYFVDYKRNDVPSVIKTKEIKGRYEEIVDFPFPSYAKKIRSVLSEYGSKILAKCPHQGCNELRGAVADYLIRNRGFSVQKEQIIIGSGSEYLYGLLIQMLGNNLEYAIEQPSYEQIEMVYRANGVTYERLSLHEDGIDSSALKRTHAEVLHVSPYRSYPSGYSAGAAKKREYLSWLEANPKRIIIEDDYSSEFSPSSKPMETLFALDRTSRVIYMNSFSMTIASGVRVGYMVLPKNLLPIFSEKVGFYSCTVPTFEQLVLASFLSSGEYERHLNRTRRRIRKNRA